MTQTSQDPWEFLPDDRKFVDVSRIRLPEGWLIHARGVGGRPRFGSYVYYPDQKHEWKPIEKKGILGPRRFLQWEKVRKPLEGFIARLEVPGGWLLFIDFEEEGSTAQLVFCSDSDHEWTDQPS